MLSPRAATAASMFLLSFALVLFELLLTRVFAVVLFASVTQLALALAMLGLSVGALAQHLVPSLLPDDRLERRLAWLSLAMGVAAVAAVVLTVHAPVTVQWEQPPRDYGERAAVSWDLLDAYRFSVLLPALAAPFALAGAGLAGAFQRRKEHIGLLYGADLLGGAAGALAFVPALSLLPGPDVVFLVAAACALSAAVLLGSTGWERAGRWAGGGALVAVFVAGVAAHDGGLVEVRYPAGWSETNVTYVKWTPLTRLAINEDRRGHFLLLDNTSASEIVRTEERRAELAREPHRGLVYQLHRPPAKVAILGASAGPEIAIAQSFGFTGIEAIDIAPELGDVVAARYPRSPVNPYLDGDTRRVLLDGRAAILHADHDYDIIQMVHANLHSSAGQLANAWSPALLDTREAFEVYLRRLTPGGTLSFARGKSTRSDLRAMVEAMARLGIRSPERNVLYVSGDSSVVLGKKRPWTREELGRVKAILATLPDQFVAYDPTAPDTAFWAEAMRVPLMTDDRPYAESPMMAWVSLGQAFAHVVGLGDDQVDAVTVVYHSIVLQVLFVGAVGVACALPLIRAAGTRLQGRLGGLGFVGCIGYGYLSVETVLLHELVLFVGHPVYALTVVVLAMLLFSGLGSMLVQRIRYEWLSRALVVALVLVLVLGAVQAWVVPPVLYTEALGLSIGSRALVVLVLLAPLGLVMGMPFPLAMRILRPDAAGLVPWAWAINGWTSVIASIGTVVISRLVGYDAAFAVALGVYAGALALARTLPRIGAVAA